MELVVNGEPVEEPVSGELIERSIRSLSGDGDSFVILSKDEMTYMQTSGDPKNGFILEYQEGSLDDHYSCVNTDLSTSQVVQAFQRYLSGDGRWKSDLRWEKESLGQSPGGFRSGMIVALIGLAIAAFFVWKFFNAT